MAFVKKTWKDRISQYPNRRTLTGEDMVTKSYTVGRDEGTVTEAGDSFNATNMNDLEQRIEDAIAGAGTTYTGGDNINITGTTISVKGIMTAQDAHTIWTNA